MVGLCLLRLFLVSVQEHCTMVATLLILSFVFSLSRWWEISERPVRPGKFQSSKWGSLAGQGLPKVHPGSACWTGFPQWSLFCQCHTSRSESPLQKVGVALPFSVWLRGRQSLARCHWLQGQELLRLRGRRWSGQQCSPWKACSPPPSSARPPQSWRPPSGWPSTLGQDRDLLVFSLVHFPFHQQQWCRACPPCQSGGCPGTRQTTCQVGQSVSGWPNLLKLLNQGSHWKWWVLPRLCRSPQIPENKQIFLTFRLISLMNWKCTFSVLTCPPPHSALLLASLKYATVVPFL